MTVFCLLSCLGLILKTTFLALFFVPHLNQEGNWHTIWKLILKKKHIEGQRNFDGYSHQNRNVFSNGTDISRISLASAGEMNDF